MIGAVKPDLNYVGSLVKGSKSTPQVDAFKTMAFKIMKHIMIHLFLWKEVLEEKSARLYRTYFSIVVVGMNLHKTR